MSLSHLRFFIHNGSVVSIFCPFTSFISRSVFYMIDNFGILIYCGFYVSLCEYRLYWVMDTEVCAPVQTVQVCFILIYFNFALFRVLFVPLNLCVLF